MRTIKTRCGRYGWAAVWAFGVLAVLSAGVAMPIAAQEVDEARIQLLQAKPRAYAIIEAAGRSENPRVRLGALEAAEHAPDAAFDLARAGLSDENPAVRFAALVTIGKLKLDDLADAAIDLTRDDNESVRAAALFAAARCGRKVNLSPLAGMLANGSSGARANAALLIGHLGDPQAVTMLRDMAARPMPRVSSAERTWVRLQYAEAMLRLAPDDEEVLGTIRASVYSSLDDVRVLAIQILGEVGDRAVQGGLAHIVKRDNPIQVKIAAAQSLLRIGSTQGMDALIRGAGYDERQIRKDLQSFLNRANPDSPEATVIRELLADPKALARAAAEVRAQAAIGLGYAKSEAAVKRLTTMLDDPDMVVSVAAASAVLRGTR